MPRMIPQEPTDMIVDSLHNDVAALCSAGLVQKSWLPVSRFHLFSTIEFRYRNKVHDGLEVICAEGSTIPPYILHLEIINEYDREFADEVLLRLPLLRNLRNLSLDLSMTSLTPEAKKCLTTMVHNLKTLSFCHFTFGTFDEAVDLIASASCLENIHIWDARCYEGCNHSSQAIAPPLKQISFGMDVFEVTEHLMDWFCRCYPIPSVHTLLISGVGLHADMPTICSFVRHMGSALENLEICCSDYEEQIGQVQAALSNQLDLSQNISLRNICLGSLILWQPDSPAWPPSCDWIVSIISRIAHRSLESVTLNVFPYHAEDIHVLELSTLETLFLRQPLSEISTKLCFSIYATDDRNRARAMLKDRLPGLDAQGRLEFKFDVMKFNTRCR